jgi:hypothetical protein
LELYYCRKNNGTVLYVFVNIIIFLHIRMKMHEAEREAKEILHACGESVAFSEDSADAPTRPPGRAAAAVGCAAVALALVSWSGCFHRSTALLARDGGANYAQMCTVACAGRGGGIWGQGGSARTCAVCRLARKQARVQLLPGEGGVVQSLSGMGTVWSTVEDDEYGVSTPMSLPAGGNDDKMVDGEGMTYFPKEFSGCFDHGDHDGFRNDRVAACCTAPLSSSPARAHSRARSADGDAGLTRHVRVSV